MRTALVWFRRDLRLGDHPALSAAAASADRVLPVFVLDPALSSSGRTRTERLLASLAALREETDGALVLRSGDPAEVLPALAAQLGAEEVHVSAETTPYGHGRDQRVARRLAQHTGPEVADGAARFVSELAWREFYVDVLWHTPRSRWQDWRSDLHALRYDDDPGLLEAWRAGRTGYPFVDAGMRQLLAEGWMHNRVRMVTASFLVKDLHQWWPIGARHFLEHLQDGDVASNNHGWQWVAGTGTDAAPYFRIFNPVLQGKRHDPEGDYVRRWVPELRHLVGAAVHEPWRHPDGYRHGYSERIVDHESERRGARARCYEARQVTA